MENEKLKTESEEKTFRDFHNELRQRNRMCRRVHTSTEFLKDEKKDPDDTPKYRGVTYSRERREGEARGKAAKKAAKRERVRQMKAAEIES